MGVTVEDGTLDGSALKSRYYLLWKKIYSKRFASDSTGAFFEERSLRSSVGLNDVDEYETERATWDELCRQGSYMIADWMKWNEADKYVS